MEVQRDGLRVRAVSRHQVDAEVLDGGIEVFFDDGLQTMDLVDEQDVARRELRQHPGERALVIDGGSRGGVEVDAKFVGEDVGERRLPEAGWTVEQQMVE